MATIGTFTKTADGYTGTIKTPHHRDVSARLPKPESGLQHDRKQEFFNGIGREAVANG